jgi:hypothetical protein
MSASRIRPDLFHHLACIKPPQAANRDTSRPCDRSRAPYLSAVALPCCAAIYRDHKMAVSMQPQISRSQKRNEPAIVFHNFITWSRIPMSDGVGELLAVEGVEEFQVGDKIISLFFPNWRRRSG